MWIKKNKTMMNLDEGSYQLSHVWNKLLTDTRNRKSAMMKTSDWRLKLISNKIIKQNKR